MDEADWEQRLELLWASIDERHEDDLLAAMDALVVERPPDDPVGLFEHASAVRAFLALALTSVGREREAVSVALTALAPHLKRYNRSLAAYALEVHVDRT